MSVPFPSTYPIAKRSSIDVLDNIAHDYMDDGTLHSRKLGELTHERIRCEIAALSQVDYISLKAFIKANRASDISMTLDGQNYVGRVTSGVRVIKRGAWFEASFDYYATAS